MTGLAVTTSRAERASQVGLALALGHRLGAPFLRRRERTVRRLLADEGLDSVVVVEAEQPVWREASGGKFFFHPNMAVGRLRSMERTPRVDPLIHAAGLAPGDRVLDGTLGLGADAIVASRAVGSTGLVVGLEAVLVTAVLTAHGLQTYDHRFAAPMRRIRVIPGDHRRHLVGGTWLARAGWDAILLDPMFETTIPASAGLAGIRRLACYDPLTPEVIEAARRWVRKAVVVKTHGGEAWLTELPPTRLQRGRGAVGYAVYEPH